MGKKIAIIQSNYIPWIGYFDIINRVDEFVFLDSVQYTTRDWRNRNRLMTSKGYGWLTIPVCHVERSQKISSTRIVDNLWCEKHLSIIKQHYHSAPFFEQHIGDIESWYSEAKELDFLSDINVMFIKKIMALLGITTSMLMDSYYLDERDYCDASERLAVIAEKAGASLYLSGPAAKKYMNLDVFYEKKIDIEWVKYPEYPSYYQGDGGFDCHVSIIDALLFAGVDFVNNSLK